MFIIELTYTADLARIDKNMRAHMQFINAHYASGHFVASGRKIPRDGGIILVVGKDRAEIEAIAQQDPFVTKGLATARVIEFRVSQRAEDVAGKFEVQSSPLDTARGGPSRGRGPKFRV